MENLSYYLDKLKYISSLFDKIITFDNNNYIITGNKFVFQLVLDMCNDKVLQEKVLSKLKEYTSYTTMYLSGVQLKPNYFDDIVQIYHKFIIDFLSNSKTIEETLTTGFIINFTLHNDEKCWEPSEIWCNEIMFEPDGTKYHVDDEAGSLYHYDAIFMESIVGDKTIQKYGIDGFLALLIIFLKEDELLFKNNVESLLSLCQKNLAIKFNEMCAKTTDFSYDEFIECYEIDYDKLHKELKPKDSIRRWINFFDSISYLPNSVIEDSSRYMHDQIQMVLFKEIRTEDGEIVVNYDTDYDDLINDLMLNKFADIELMENIKTIMKIKDIKEWHAFLNKLVQMDDSFITNFFLKIDSNFAFVFLGIRIAKNDFFSLKMKTQKWYEVIKGKFYDRYMEIYNNTGPVKLSYVNWLYDKKLNCTGCKVVEYDSDYCERNDKDYQKHISFYDEKNNLLPE
ncbi:putative ORFan [Tupanvirus deep ocean]|uniref:ORFan n=2 Tax=Tupanvirus TaxID=2094720 RepID=A0AC62A7E8_9VIRU|nr:putative ORFan [Tupanvirus deep ocean]QKU33716.1 putative ORFan [Tupanvirus deep ocean]